MKTLRRLFTLKGVLVAWAVICAMPWLVLGISAEIEGNECGSADEGLVLCGNEPGDAMVWAALLAAASWAVGAGLIWGAWAAAARVWGSGVSPGTRVQRPFSAAPDLVYDALTRAVASSFEVQGLDPRTRTVFFRRGGTHMSGSVSLAPDGVAVVTLVGVSPELFDRVHEELDGVRQALRS